MNKLILMKQKDVNWTGSVQDNVEELKKPSTSKKKTEDKK